MWRFIPRDRGSRSQLFSLFTTFFFRGARPAWYCPSSLWCYLSTKTPFGKVPNPGDTSAFPQHVIKLADNSCRLVCDCSTFHCTFHEVFMEECYSCHFLWLSSGSPLITFALPSHHTSCARIAPVVRQPHSGVWCMSGGSGVRLIHNAIMERGSTLAFHIIEAMCAAGGSERRCVALYVHAGRAICFNAAYPDSSWKRLSCQFALTLDKCTLTHLYIHLLIPPSLFV